MLETYFSASKLLGHLRNGPSGPYLDGFAVTLERQGYSADTAVRYLRAAAHFGHVMARQGVLPSDIDLAVFSEHLRTCRCPRAMGYATHLMTALGGDPERWEPADIRRFFLEQASHRGNGTLEKLTISLRGFLRHLAVKGCCQEGLADIVPSYAHWRLADLPRYLTAKHVNRLIAACDGEVVARRRDRAIVLLLVRLGLRAGDVAQLRFDDIEWETGSLRVSGKSRYEVRLPLPQDVGDAIVAYLACRPSTLPSPALGPQVEAVMQVCPSDHVFLRNIAPFRPFRNGDGVSSMVRHLMQQAGIVAPVKGAHVLRHTAATEMLRHGVPLEKIGLVQRHRGIDTTAYYAKANVALLKQVAQPWLEVI